jgi:ssDNA-binding replication factor A large subunit
MTIEQMLNRILSSCPSLSKEEILERLEKEKGRTGGLISDEILMRFVAAEFGVEVECVGASMPLLLIKDLVPHLNDVTVVGRVVAVFSARAFSGRSTGKFASLLVADDSDVLRVVLWNDQASLVELGKVLVGQVVRFSHGYTKEGRGGKVELHIGSKCEVEIGPVDVQAESYPSIERFLTRIGELAHGHLGKKVNVSGSVKRPFAASDFVRQDSSVGKVMRFILADDTGEVPVVAWNEKAEELEKAVRQGVRLQLVDARVRRAMNEGVEVHVDGGSYYEVLAEGFLRIRDLKEGLSHVNVEGVVAGKPMFREVKTSGGELVRLATFELRDDTGSIWFSAWRAHSDVVSNLTSGEKVVVRNVSVKRGFGEQLELSSRDGTSIVIVH